jgi:hypothetical protein
VSWPSGLKRKRVDEVFIVKVLHFYTFCKFSLSSSSRVFIHVLLFILSMNESIVNVLGEVNIGTVQVERDRCLSVGICQLILQFHHHHHHLYFPYLSILGTT